MIWPQVLIGILVVLAAASPSSAQPAARSSASPRVEIWGGLTAAPASPTGSIVSAYSPPLLLDGDFVSYAAQTIALDGGAGLGFDAGANLFLTPYAGIQLVFDRRSSTVTGVNGPYDLTLQYTSRPPPNNEPIPVTIGVQSAWPDTSGSISHTTIGVNGVIRILASPSVNLTFSAGLSAYRLRGEVQPLAYTTFRLGGHSVLFADEYRLAATLEPTSSLGFNAGGDLNVRAGANAALMIGYRYLGGPAVEMPIRVATILNADEITFQQSTTEIQQRLAPAPAQVKIGGSRFRLGLKLTF